MEQENVIRPKLLASGCNAKDEYEKLDLWSREVICYWPSPTQSFWVSGTVGTHDDIFVRFKTMHVF
jgi:hypothetical protein